jgi:hypothetical protein
MNIQHAKQLIGIKLLAVISALTVLFGGGLGIATAHPNTVAQRQSRSVLIAAVIPLPPQVIAVTQSSR